MTKYTNLIFDLDGTLINSSADIIDCITQTYNEILPQQIILFDKFKMGPTFKEILPNIIPNINESDFHNVVKQFRLIYDNYHYPQTILYPHVQNELIKLYNNKVNLYIATNKPLLPTTKILNKFNLTQYFKDIICIDSPNIKNKADMINYILQNYKLNNFTTLFLGDSMSDINAAIINNIQACAACWGYEQFNPLLNDFLKFQSFKEFSNYIL